MVNPAPLDVDVVLSAAWLDAILAPRYPGVRVAGTTVVEELVTIASKVRFRVDYVDGSPAGPRALCVKGYFAPESRAMVSAGQIEARFYADVAPRLDIRVPPCHHAAIDPGSGHGVVLMTDLVAGGCRFLTALSPYSVDQAASTLEQVARLHAADPATLGVGDVEWLAPRLDGYLDYVAEERLQAQLDDGRCDGLDVSVRDAARIRAGLRAIAARSAADARFLVHGDAHAGNLYVDGDGAPGLIDWQVVQRGSWALDVAYHVGAVLSVDDRTSHERALLRHYLDAARAFGADVPDDALAWDQYRDALVYGYYMWAITQRVERPVIEEFVARLGRAVEAHESLDRLGV
jgi:aminoglycoside phosphotransferase (APT) family kinase protein